ncbi:hypothetical protein [Neobacillus mesonae]|uniref:hypothetical protein n=1 Tax=Neobacillus mesonae TaxID=1193713 RepID=UPI0013E07707|nr:hypothetical protein [Neobacillus mesonae]
MKLFYLAGFSAYLIATLALIFFDYKPDEFVVFVSFIVSSLFFGTEFLNEKAKEAK